MHRPYPYIYPYGVNGNGAYQHGYNSTQFPFPYDGYLRQQTVSGQATWTEGGQVTKCGIPWSANQYMTAAVGPNSPYQCGQTLKIRNPATGREILVTIVDETAGYAQNQITLHRRAFETLGANPQQGVLNVEISPIPELEQQKWGKYLLEIIQTAYPSYQVTEYNFTDKKQTSPEQKQETYEYILQSPRERITVQGTAVYNPKNDRIISFDIREK
ncbi:DUF3889 domain-containing protein [Lentibacillus juripiscarius]|uniref:DUF3889 domain-containing protein n=1 Tax=Lentibacillus juripiscarius TaxID=257446 RepID=A0ABW5V839_9BACI